MTQQDTTYTEEDLVCIILRYGKIKQTAEFLTKLPAEFRYKYHYSCPENFSSGRWYSMTPRHNLAAELIEWHNNPDAEPPLRATTWSIYGDF